jgi:hypothetical protein
MKHFVDIHTLLSTADDMEDIHDDPYEASEKLNTILHMVYDATDEDIETERLEKLLTKTWHHWHQDSYLLDIEVDDLVDWVDHLLSTEDNDDELS